MSLSRGPSAASCSSQRPATSTASTATPKSTTVGFVYRDADKLVGCSPDGIVGDDGLIELKCPKPGTHLRWLSVGTVPRQHSIQVQGQLWVSGLAWVDFMSYHPGLPPLIVRAEPDEKLQAAFDEAIPAFIDELMAGREKFREMGIVPAGEIEPGLDPIEELVGGKPLEG